MSLLGIDVGTTGCKAAVFNTDGALRALAYAEYPMQMPRPGWGMLAAEEVWTRVQETVQRAVAAAPDDPVEALAVSSLGEAVVPVSADRRVLGPSILNFDARGAEYLPALAAALPPERLYDLTGQILANHYGLTKLMWIREHQPHLYEQARWFLPWGSFVGFMLGADPVVDYSLACRLLCLDIDRGTWAAEVLAAAGLAADKLPRPAPAGTVVGTVADAVAARLGLPRGVAIVLGCHDQCATALGCGVVDPGPAACSMGTFFCLTPVFRGRRPAGPMLRQGLSTEHHGAAGRFVTLIYNQGGVLLRWFRDTFAAAEQHEARRAGRDVYPELLAEMPAGPSPVVVLPHFIATGPPEFITDSAGVLAGLHLDTQRGDILKGILEGVVFYLRECLEGLPESGIAVREFRAAGGGSRSDAWLQICADILERPFTRVAQSEAGILGAAILAGVGHGRFRDCAEAAGRMVQLERTLAPEPARVACYRERFAHYRRLGPLLRPFLRALPAG